MSLLNSVRAGIGWISQRNAPARELIERAKAAHLEELEWVSSELPEKIQDVWFARVVK